MLSLPLDSLSRQAGVHNTDISKLNTEAAHRAKCQRYCPQVPNDLSRISVGRKGDEANQCSRGALRPGNSKTMKARKKLGRRRGRAGVKRQAKKKLEPNGAKLPMANPPTRIVRTDCPIQHKGGCRETTLTLKCGSLACTVPRNRKSPVDSDPHCNLNLILADKVVMTC